MLVSICRSETMVEIEKKKVMISVVRVDDLMDLLGMENLEYRRHG